MFIALANRFSTEGILEKSRSWLLSAMYNLSGNYDLQTQINNTIDNGTEFDIKLVYNLINADHEMSS